MLWMIVLNVVLFCAAGGAAAPFAGGLLPNGEFELGPKPWEMQGSKVTAQDGVPKWRIGGLVEYIKSGQKQGDMLLVVPRGAAAVRLGNEGLIKQTVELRMGLCYSITFSAARTCAQEERLNVSVAPASGRRGSTAVVGRHSRDCAILPMQTVYSSNGWDSYAWAFKARGQVIEVLIHNPGTDEDPACGPLIDSVALQPLYLPKPTRDNILKNGNFEEGPYVLPNSSWGVLIPPNSNSNNNNNIENDHSALPGWMIDSLKAVKYIDSDHFAVPAGRRAVELVGGKESAISQVVRTVPGRLYALTFAVGDARDSCVGSMAVEAFAGRDTVKVPYESKDGRGGSVRAMLRFKAERARTRIMFFSTFYSMSSDHTGSLCGPVLDDVRLLSVRDPRKR